MTFNNYFRSITGVVADQYFADFGINATRIRYNDREINPRPIVGDQGIQPHTDGAEYQVYDGEELQQFTTSIPGDSLKASLGADWAIAIRPDAEWQVSLDDGRSWIDVRIAGTPKVSRTGRYGFTLVGEGIGQ